MLKIPNIKRNKHAKHLPFIAKQIVEEAGRIIHEARETNSFGFEFKSDNTPLTNID